MLVIRDGRVIDPSRGFDDIADVVIEAGRVTRVGRNAAAGLSGERIRFIDAKEHWVVPGFVDLHAHFREPGFVSSGRLRLAVIHRKRTQYLTAP